MNEEEFIQACKEWNIDTNFKNMKDKLFYMYCIAEIERKKIEIVKLSKRKCYRKIMSNQGLTTSKWATMRNYDNELKSYNGKYEIIEANII